MTVRRLLWMVLLMAVLPVTDILASEEDVLPTDSTVTPTDSLRKRELNRIRQTIRGLDRTQEDYIEPTCCPVSRNIQDIGDEMFGFDSQCLSRIARICDRIFR